jgi:hypothetical protein
MKGKAFLREWAMELGFIIMVFGIMLLFFTTLGLFFSDQTPQLLVDIVKPLHESNWDMWGFLFGILLFIVGVLLFGDKVIKGI